MLGELTPNKDGDIALKNGGRRLRVRLKPKDREANVLTHNQMEKFHSKVTKEQEVRPSRPVLEEGLSEKMGPALLQTIREEKKKKAASPLD